MELLRCRHGRRLRKLLWRAQKYWHLSEVFTVWRFNLNIENFIGLAFEARPLDRFGIGLAT